MFTEAGDQFGLTPALVWLPALVLYVGALSLGAGLWLSALTAKYRDFTFLTPILVQIWMYATPIIYPLSQVPERFRLLASLNPMVMPTEAAKLMFLGQGLVTASSVALSVTVTVVLLLTGILIFNRVEKTFVDTV